MPLVNFIRSHTEEIAEKWEEFAKTLPAARGMAEPALRDHLPRILQAITDDMEKVANAARQSKKDILKRPDEPLERVSDAHARLRLDSGFDLKQVIAEYRGLRASVLGLWNSSATAVTGTEITELIRFNDAVDQLIAEVLTRYIDRATQYSDRFIAILGHDLRNPFDAISGCASLLQESAHSDERHARAISLILRSCQRIGRLINDLLDFARSRLGGPLPLTKTSTDLGDICRSVLEEVKAAHPDRVLELETIGDLSGEWDKERLAQLVSNLAANAVEHGSGERIRMVARDQGPGVVLEINNRGNPIAPELLPSIFDPLVHGRRGDSGERSDGLGLGSFIAREIVAAHEGTIEVAYSASEVTTFKVSLPRRAKAQRATK